MPENTFSNFVTLFVNTPTGGSSGCDIPGHGGHHRCLVLDGRKHDPGLERGHTATFQSRGLERNVVGLYFYDHDRLWWHSTTHEVLFCLLFLFIFLHEFMVSENVCYPNVMCWHRICKVCYLLGKHVFGTIWYLSILHFSSFQIFQK